VTVSKQVSASGTTQKRPWLAALLAILYPGLGHVYLRKWGRALLWFATIIVSSTLLIPPDAVPNSITIDGLISAGQSIPLPISLSILTITLLSVVDAYVTAKQINRQSRAPAAPTTSDEAAGSCPHCGKELDEDLDFCPWCSERLVEPEPDEESEV
jgi:uncharacterized paraquat-inducible protein A